MDSVDRSTISALARHLAWPSVSIMSPLHRAGSEKEQDPIRFKNLLKRASELLREAEVRGTEAESLLRPANLMLDDPGFWREAADGLAIFLAEGATHVFKVDVSLPEHVSVSERFAIRPLMPALHGIRKFYVLALSKNKVRLLEASHGIAEEIDLSGAPESLAEALRFDDYERQVQFHSGTPALRGGRRAAVFHGHGGAPDVEKDQLHRYLRMVDKGIRDYLRDENAPLILAGVDYVLAIYREVNSYPHLIDESMSGNPDEFSAGELYGRAYSTLEPHFRSEMEADLDAFDSLVATGGASANLPEIVSAAHEGRVRVLFVTPAEGHRGHFDASTGQVRLSDTPGAGDWDLADLAATETLLHGGTVHTLEPGEAPADAAAIFRY